MRGAHTKPVLKGQEMGIIPADAGSTSFDKGEAVLTMDHPRGCGEHGFIWPSGIRP